MNGTTADISLILDSMESLPLEKAMAIDLMERFDEKFVGSALHLPGILKGIQNRFLVQSTGSKRFSEYRTLYWDTNNLDFFKDHSRGKSKRAKIRKRLYTETNTSFLEIKRSVSGKTFKTRVRSEFTETFSENDLSFLTLNGFDCASLTPVLYIEYQRIILWDKAMEGRMTIDLVFTPYRHEKTDIFDNIFIFEIKGSRAYINKTIRSIDYPIDRNRTSFTKYGIGLIHNMEMDTQNAKGLFSIYKKLLKLNQPFDE